MTVDKVCPKASLDKIICNTLLNDDAPMIQLQDVAIKKNNERDTPEDAEDDDCRRQCYDTQYVEHNANVHSVDVRLQS